MKKNKRSRTLLVLSKIFNIKEWVDFERLKSSTAYLKNGVQRLFVPGSASRDTSFEAVQKKMGLSESELQNRQKGLKRLCFIMVVVGTLLLFYGSYHLYSYHISAAVISYFVCFIAFILAFRYHYWAFLITQRKLESSLKEWFILSFKGGKHE